MTFPKFSSCEHDANRENLTTIVNFEADIVRTVLVAFGLALCAGVGEDVVEVRSGLAGPGWSVGKWRQRFLAAESARLKARQFQTSTVRNRRRSSDLVDACWATSDTLLTKNLKNWTYFQCRHRLPWWHYRTIHSLHYWDT